VQETILKALKARDQYHPGTNFRAWIFKIMTNLYIDEYRKRDRTPGEVPLDSVYDLHASGSADPFEGVDEVTEVDVLEKVLPDQVLRALDALPETHRTTVLLRDLGGFSYKEIAQILGCPIGTVMSRLHYARQELKKLLSSHAKTRGYLSEPEE